MRHDRDLRLLPLLGHPSGAVRFSAVRLLSRYPALAVRHVPDATRDVSPQIRAAALETLRATTSGEALRCALELLDDPHPLVRSHAVRTAGAVSGAGSALVVAALGDESWWVRDAARETLTAAGSDVAESVRAALEDENLDVRRGAALVLQDLGLGEPVAPGGADVSGAQDRARRGIALGRPVIALESA